MAKYNWKQSVAPALMVLLLFIVGGGLLAYKFVNLEKERAWNEWQVRLGLIADTRTSLITRWTNNEFTFLKELSGNASLQLYLSQLAIRKPTEGSSAEPAQLSYLRNLIKSSASRGGYSQERSTSSIPANVDTRNSAGLMLLDNNAKPVVSSVGMSAIDADVKALAEQVLNTAKHKIVDIHIDSYNNPVIGFLMPVFSLAGASSKPVGILYGVKNAATELYPLLRQEGLSLESEETLLVRKSDDALVYLSPLSDNKDTLQRLLPFDPDKLASAYVTEHPGGFTVSNDYSGKSVLATSRNFASLPWTLIQKVDESEALQEYREYRNNLIIILTLMVTLVAASLVAAWKHGSSLRSRLHADEIQKRSREVRAQWKLLTTITDNIGDVLFLVDKNNQFTFANAALSALIHIEKEEFTGKDLINVFGPDNGHKLANFINLARERDSVVTSSDDIEIDNEHLTYHSIALPLQIEGRESGSILMVAHDVTRLMDVQKKRGRLMNQLVSVLVRLIDLHDPHCIDHSVRTADIASAIGGAMDLDKLEIETLTLAAKLANLGKIFMPKDLLTKPGKLSDAERSVMRDGEQLANDTLAQLEFDGPVTEIIAQKKEFLDGSGTPNGLKGEEIHICARILAVANAFVAMTSDRAYREGMEIDEAMDILLKDSNRRFDRKVVGALFYLVENHPEVLEIERVTNIPAGLENQQTVDD